MSDKVAIVTGAGSRGPGIGTGRAISVLFAREGARLCLIDNVPGRAEETVAMIRAEGAEDAEPLVQIADVSTAADCARVVDATIERFGRLDVLVNNVGITGGRLEPLDEADFDRVIAVNLKSAVLMSAEAVLHMEHGGSIVNIASVAGILAGGGGAYGLSKAAMIQLARELAVCHGRRGIRANTIAPGHIATPLAANVMPGAVERRVRIAPLGIEGNAWDVAWAAVFLASDEARFVTGTCIPVDGGATVTLPLHALTFLENPSDS